LSSFRIWKWDGFPFESLLHGRHKKKGCARNGGFGKIRGVPESAVESAVGGVFEALSEERGKVLSGEVRTAC